jgi:hypothetical protein
MFKTPKEKKRQKQQKNKFKIIVMSINCKIMNEVKDMFINIVTEKICKSAPSLPCSCFVLMDSLMKWICF